jgi:hypothetical protein
VALKKVEVELNKSRKMQLEAAAEAALRDLAWMMESAQTESKNDELEGAKLIALLRRNFKKLDSDSDGISKAELLAALAAPTGFSEDEYAMLSLLCRYFDMVINLSDDEPGEETRITRSDMRVLEQFLVHGRFTLAGLHKWLNVSNKEITEQDVGPPPMQKD